MTGLSPRVQTQKSGCVLGSHLILWVFSLLNVPNHLRLVYWLPGSSPVFADTVGVLSLSLFHSMNLDIFKASLDSRDGSLIRGNRWKVSTTCLPYTHLIHIPQVLCHWLAKFGYHPLLVQEFKP